MSRIIKHLKNFLKVKKGVMNFLLSLNGARVSHAGGAGTRITVRENQHIPGVVQGVKQKNHLPREQYFITVNSRSARHFT